MTPESKRFLLIGGAVFLAIAVMLAIFFGHNKPDPSKSVTRTDSDTGEVIVSEPNRTPERDGSNSDPVLLGAYILTDNGMTQDQASEAQKAIFKFANENLHRKYDLLKLLPNKVNAGTGTIVTELKLGDNGHALPISFTFSQLNLVRVTISDPSGTNGGNFDSGTLTTPQSSEGGYDGS